MGIPADAKPGLMTMLGAGELMLAVGALHRDALKQLRTLARALFLGTSASFESNAEAIIGRAVDYCKLRLHTKLDGKSCQHAGLATASDTARAVAAVCAATIILTGRVILPMLLVNGGIRGCGLRFRKCP